MGHDQLDPSALALASYYSDATPAPTTTTTTTSTLPSSYYSSEVPLFHPASPVVPPAPPPPPTFRDVNGLKLKNMDAHCVGEDKDASMIRGSASNWQARVNAENPSAPNLTSVTTHYMDDPERTARSVSSNNGKLVDASGQLLDTTGASGIGTFNKEGAQKHIFTMDGDKAIRTADPWAEKKITQTQDGANLGFINHSSFTGGKAVAGAGEMRVEKGELQQVSDQSGHYKPDGEMVGQTLDQLGAMGINMDKTSLKLVGKSGGQKPLYVSPTQFQQHDAMTAEAEIRSEKAALHGELLGAVNARKSRLGVADSEGEPAPNQVSSVGYLNADLAAPTGNSAPANYLNNTFSAPPPSYITPLPTPANYLNAPASTSYRNAEAAPPASYTTPLPTPNYLHSPAPTYRNADAGYIDALPLAPTAYKNFDPSLFD